MTNRTIHVLHGTRYVGAFENATTRPASEVPEARGDLDGWLQVQSPRFGSSVSVLARPEDLFDTETDARTEAKARRRPRQTRTAPALYGDFALLARFSGVSTDGTGRRNR